MKKMQTAILGLGMGIASMAHAYDKDMHYYVTAYILLDRNDMFPLNHKPTHCGPWESIHG